MTQKFNDKDRGLSGSHFVTLTFSVSIRKPVLRVPVSAGKLLSLSETGCP
jgi:hypothetical protein